MRIFKSFFRRNNLNENLTSQVKPPQTSNSITYKPNLINNLKNDHQEIIEKFKEIVVAVNANNFIALPEKLRSFKLELQSHILVENVHFYVYVEQKLERFPDQCDFVHDVRKEMNVIAKAVVTFVKKYQLIAFTPNVKEEFKSELNEIGKILLKRVEMEETRLYTLYED